MEVAVTTGLTNKNALTSESHNFLARDWIAGLERGLGVIEAFDENHSRMTAQQVGERCGLSRTAARRYLLTLQHLGYVSSDSKQFWLTPRIMRLGQSYLSSARLPRIAQPVLQRVSASLQEVVYLAVLDEGEVVYVSRNGPNRAMSSGFVLGARVPGHVTSAGMLMLANLPSAQLEEWFASHELPAYTPYTIATQEDLRKEIKRIRQQGWALSEQQFDLAFRGVAVPLKDLRGDLMGALSVLMPIQGESSEAVVKRIVPVLQEAAQSLRNLI
jgi:IclR family pca regulon transcriptional regulator